MKKKIIYSLTLTWFLNVNIAMANDTGVSVAQSKIENLLSDTPIILFDAVVGDLIYGINEARKGVYLACSNHIAANDDMGLMSTDLGRELGNVFASNYTSFKREYFIHETSLCLRELARMIRYLPSIKPSLNLGHNIILMPSKSTETKYHGTVANNIIIGFSMHSTDETLHEDINQILSPISDLNNKTLENLILELLGGK